MSAHSEGASPSRPDGGGGARHVDSATGSPLALAGHCPSDAPRSVSCEIHDGLPTVHGQMWSYYVSHHGGRRMLVLEGRRGDRIRINEATEIVILEIHPDYVKIAIEGSTDPSAGG